MKWYAKQVADLTKKSDNSQKTHPLVSKGVAREHLAPKKVAIVKPTFVNPVKMRNVNRPKTDSK